MKKFFLGIWLFAALSLIFSASNLKAEENLLTNPGFEDGLEGWFEWNSAEEAAIGGISTECYHSGNYSGKRWLLNSEGLTYSCFVQDINVKVEEGDVISLSGWLMSPPDDPLSEGAAAFLVIEFWWDAKKIAHPESKRLNSQSQWKQFEVSGTVPKGTDVVKACLFLFGSGGSKGTVYFDDIKATIKSKKILH